MDEEPILLNNEANLAEEFNEFWLVYPKDDAFRHFFRTRPLRWNKQETYTQYKIARQKYSHHQLLGALHAEIQYRADGGNENLFKYMKGSVNWLKEEAFLNFLDEEKIEHKNAYGKDLML